MLITPGTCFLVRATANSGTSLHLKKKYFTHTQKLICPKLDLTEYPV
jgi:hypothetical protein